VTSSRLRCAIITLALAAIGCELPVVVGSECTGKQCAGAAAVRPCQGPACQRAQRCVAQQNVGRAGLDMYLMVDASSSQIFSWSTMLTGLTMFLTDPASTGVGVGLQFFGDSCDPETYATPAAPIMSLPQNATAILAVFPVAPVLETATRPALEGAIRYARRWQEAHPTRTVIVSLVTDGLPEECESTPENVSMVASEGLSGSPSIRTFVVGIDSLGSIFKFAGNVAAFGGAPVATVNMPQSPEAIAGALASIRDAAGACRFAVPAPVTTDVNSRLTQMAEDGSSSEEPMVAGESACDPVRGGFYVHPDQPQLLHACPASCARLAAGGALELHTDCPSG
jgi:hypothetical protein